MVIGVPAETLPGERLVALTPLSIEPLTAAGNEILVEPGAGLGAGFSDAEYREKGARIAADRHEVLGRAEILVQVRTLGANPGAGRADLERLRPGQTLIGFSDPLGRPEAARELAARGVELFAVELVPRITRAQSMDALSALASIAGYKAVLLAAERLPRMFPMMMTAAGTIAPARVLVIGAGVAGLQAIATARRLGAVVEAYDVRPAVKEQVQSLGARFVELELDSESAEGSGGYARAMDEEFYRRQRELLTRVVAASDVLITTAAVPGRQAPLLVTSEMVGGMAAGSVIVDLAAATGGNCEPTRADQVVAHSGVTVLGPSNLAATVPFHASQMYARNLTALLLHLAPGGELRIDLDDPITAGALVTRGSEIVNPRVREALGLDAESVAAGEGG